MKIGILGTRGIPNSYGGFEQFAQYLAEGLTLKGNDVYVYNSNLHPYQNGEWNGIKIIHCKDLEDKLGTPGQFIYDLNCLRDARKRNFDILLQLGYTSNSVWHSLWPRQSVNIINMDGLEWMRTKYNSLTQKFLRRAEYWAAKYGQILIADSIGIQEYLRDKYNRSSIYIPYGAHVFKTPNLEYLKEWDLTPHQYHLVICRMEPENNVEVILQGYLQSQNGKSLILVGNTNNKFGQYLVKNYSQPGIKFLGSIYDEIKINNLRYYSSLYFHGHSVGGTNPSLLEAMACGCSIASHDNPFNRAILNEDAFFFQNANDIHLILEETKQNVEKMKRWSEHNLEKIKSLYSWEKIINEYENIFEEAVAKRQPLAHVS